MTQGTTNKKSFASEAGPTTRRGMLGTRVWRTSDDAAGRAFAAPSWHAAHPAFVRAARLLPIAFALHELEEWNILAYYRAHFPQGPPMSTTNVRIALIAVIPIAWLWVRAALRAASPRRAAYIILPLAAALSLNALQHIYVIGRYRDYGPGIVTAVTLLIPVSLLLARSAWREGIVPHRFLAAAGVLVIVTFGVWAIRPEANMTQKMLSADRIGAALYRLVEHDPPAPA
jgi:hypothetical protein